MSDELHGLPRDLALAVCKHTQFPWWNGPAYADYKGYPQRLKAKDREIRSAVDDLHDVIEWLREQRDFEKADRLRTIAGRLARAADPDDFDTPDQVAVQARGWK